MGSSLRTCSVEEYIRFLLCDSLIHMAGGQGGVQEARHATHKDTQRRAINSQ